MLDTKYLQELYKEGFVPGPKEDDLSFQKRVALVKTLLASPEIFLEKLKIPYAEILHVTPYFLSIRGKKKLPFWFGAMTWIYEEEGHKIPILELPQKTRGIGLTQDDLIAHEEIHFLRASFNEPKFEEILAYRTSRSGWRRILGPLFQHPWESYVAIILCLFIPFFPLLAATIALPLFRLTLYQWLFKRALKKLSLLYTNAEELIVLFTDREIIKLAFSHYPNFEHMSLRGKLIEQIALL